MSAYEQLKTALEAHKPDGWAFKGFEPLEDIPDVTGITMKIRAVRPLAAAPIGALEVDWIVTITSPTPSRETADPQLFDDLIEFLAELDADEELSWLVWTEAVKVVGDDLLRLAYDINVRIHTEREVPAEPA